MKIRVEEVEETKTPEKGFDFNAYIAEGWMHKAIDEAEDPNAPKIGTTAKDYADEECEIVDVLELPASQRKLDYFLDQYDDSGVMRDCYRDPEGYGYDPSNYEYLVAVEHPNLGRTAVYVWGPEGVCYGNSDNAPEEDVEEGCHKVNELKREPKQATKSDLKGFASKEATLNRAKRAEKGNWKNSIGAFVEKHSAEIGNVSPLGKDALVNYIETKMKPELSDEAKAKVDELVNSSRSITDLMFALYNTMLKGAGMGLHEDLVSEETGKKTQQGSEVKSDSKSLDDILTKFKEISNWGEEMEIFKFRDYHGEMIATITFNCDPMVDDFGDDSSIRSFSKQNGITIIPFTYNVDLPYNGDPWDYDLIASGYVLLRDPLPRVYPVKCLEVDGPDNYFLEKLQKYIDKIAPEYSVDGSEEIEERVELSRRVGREESTEYADELMQAVWSRLPDSITEADNFDPSEIKDCMRAHQEELTGDLEKDAQFIADNFSDNPEYWKHSWKSWNEPEEEEF